MTSPAAMLKRRISLLARRLPRSSPTGTYTPYHYDATLAFRLLAHAELESCLEELSVQTVTAALNNFRRDGVARRPLLGVLAFYGDAKLPKVGGDPLEDYRVTLDKAVTKHHQAVRGNNGIREKDLARLLLPVGLVEAELDPLWVADMDTFGRRRGDAAHQSMRTQAAPDPVDEKQLVGRLVAGVRPLEQTLFRSAR